MNGHTPGPYVFGRTGPEQRMILGGPDRRYVCSIQVHQKPRYAGAYDEPGRLANADHVLACLNACNKIKPEAVPEILEALKLAEIHLRLIHEAVGPAARGPGPSPPLICTFEAWRQAYDAINRIEGRQP